MSKRASYRVGVSWIALNDEPDCDEIDFVASMISTMLLADLFGKTYEAVAADIIRYRKKESN